MTCAAMIRHRLALSSRDPQIRGVRRFRGRPDVRKAVCEARLSCYTVLLIIVNLNADGTSGGTSSIARRRDSRARCLAE